MQRDAAPAVDSPVSSAGPPRGRGNVGGEGRVAGIPYNWQEMIGGRLHTHTHTLLKVRTHVPKRKVEAHIRTVVDVEGICTHTPDE